jgi:hypothetical protein
MRVVPLHKPVNEDLVENLRDALASAERGDLISGVICAVRADRSVETWISRTEEALLELAAVDRLHHRLHRRLDETVFTPVREDD